MTTDELEEAVAAIAGEKATAAERDLVRAALLAAEQPEPLSPGMRRAAAVALASIATGRWDWLDLAWPLAAGALVWWQFPRVLSAWGVLAGLVTRLSTAGGGPWGLLLLAGVVIAATRGLDHARR